MKRQHLQHFILISMLGMLLVACSGPGAAAPSRETGLNPPFTESNPAAAAAPENLASEILEPKDTPMENEENTLSAPFLPGTELFTFAEDEPSWYSVDDDVMGGVSSSKVAVTEPGMLLFSGTMSLENNGGFASTRSSWYAMDLSAFDGVLMRVLGDGKAYRLRISASVPDRAISYNGFFETDPETWKIVYIPFDDMVPTYLGFKMNVGPLDRTSVGSFGLMLSDKQPGEFALAVDWIRGVTEQELRALDSSSN